MQEMEDKTPLLTKTDKKHIDIDSITRNNASDRALCSSNPDYDSQGSRDINSSTYKSPNEETEQPKRPKATKVKTGKLIDLDDIVDGKVLQPRYPQDSDEDLPSPPSEIRDEVTPKTTPLFHRKKNSVEETSSQSGHSTNIIDFFKVEKKKVSSLNEAKLISMHNQYDSQNDEHRNSDSSFGSPNGKKAPIIKKNSKQKINVGSYQLGEVLGKGANGVVYKGLNIFTGDFVAIKQISKKKSSSAVKKEVEILQQCMHPNILRVIDFYDFPSQFNLIFEYVENGSLINILQKFGFFPESLVQLYIDQVLDGLDYLHQQGVIHRDIKASNILITKEGKVKLADFGVASFVQDKNEGADATAGSPYWLAPEVIEFTKYSPKSDIWSVGATIIELLTGEPPFFDYNPMTAMFKIVNEDHPPIADDVSTELREFLLRCFQKDPKNRPSARELRSLPWLSKLPRRENEISYEDLSNALTEFHQNNGTLRFTLKGMSSEKDDLNLDELLEDFEPDEMLKEANEQHKRRSVRGNVDTPSEKGRSPRFNTITAVQTIEKRKEGYLRSRHKYWFVLYDSIPLLCYYNKNEDAVKGKKPKGQIFLGGSEVLTTTLIKTEPYSFIVIQPDGQKFVLCAKNQEDLNDWIAALQRGYPNFSDNTQSFSDVIKKQQQKIKNLQRAVKVLLNEKDNINDNVRIKRPTAGFYKEFFFFLVLSVNRSEGLRGANSLNHHELFNRALKDKVPFHEWYKWIAQQVKLVKRSSSQNSEVSDSSSSAPRQSDGSNLPIPEYRLSSALGDTN